MKERSELVERALAMLTPSSRTAAPSTPASDWLTRWRDLATVTSGLDADDPRLTPVLKGLAACQHCHDSGDLDGFTQAAARVRRLMQFVPGATVRWEGAVNHRLTTLSAVAEHVHYDGGKLIVFLTWQGLDRCVADSIITQIEGPR